MPDASTRWKRPSALDHHRFRLLNDLKPGDGKNDHKEDESQRDENRKSLYEIAHDVCSFSIRMFERRKPLHEDQSLSSFSKGMRRLISLLLSGFDDTSQCLHGFEILAKYGVNTDKVGSVVSDESLGIRVSIQFRFPSFPRKRG
jgi:hypothetical protein